jgi:hypothetical protein
LGQDGGSCRSDLPDGESEIYLQPGLDSPNQLDLTRKFSFLAQEISGAVKGGACAFRKNLSMDMPVRGIIAASRFSRQQNRQGRF